MAEVTILSQIEKIRTFEKGYRATHVINTGFRFGLLGALAESIDGMSFPDLAFQLMLYEPYLKIWCQTAYHFQILDCDDQGRFKLQPFLEEVLGLDMYMQNPPAIAYNNLEKRQKETESDPLARYIRTGMISQTVNSPNASFATRRATKSMITIFLSMIFPYRRNLKSKLEDGIKLLDMGCGSGNLIIEFSHLFPNSSFVGIDPDLHGIDNAGRSIIELGLEDRVYVEDMGAEEIQYRDEFEMITMVLTLHEILPESRLDALRKVYKAMKKEGQLLIIDYPYPGSLPDFRNPRYDYGIIEQYFEALNGIVHISKEEQDELLCKAGFKNIERMPVGDGGMLDFITALK